MPIVTQEKPTTTVSAQWQCAHCQLIVTEEWNQFLLGKAHYFYMVRCP